MAVIHEEVIIIKFSKMSKDTAKNSDIIVDDATVITIEQVVQELALPGVIVEVTKT